jgi:N-acetylglucosaminyldiphosphoundecaprenol N-acetyl-beta-D-mannosaminyltransferase
LLSKPQCTREGLPEKQLIVSVGISKTSYAEVVALCKQWAAERPHAGRNSARCICVTSVHGVMMAKDDPRIANILNAADIATPDGMPLVWALRSFGSRQQQRVYGPTLMLELCRSAAGNGHRLFLYGGREETLPLLESRLTARFPGLIVAGRYSPPFRPLTESEDQQVREMIRACDADIVFVGISTPKQELWMHEHRDCFPGVTLVGVGAAFDFHAGRTRQAPAWIQRNGLEWLFRLSVEPARLWKRYILITPRFLPLWAIQKLRVRAGGAIG